MGQKVHPTGFRLSSIEPWRSRWYARQQDFGRLLLQDDSIRKFIAAEFKGAGIPRVEIERTGEAVNVIVHTARPGVLVGRKGARVDQLKESLQKMAGQPDPPATQALLRKIIWRSAGVAEPVVVRSD